MKKIVSLLAAGALALGLVGCAGDLHDQQLIDLSEFGIVGTVNSWADAEDALTANEDGTYSYSFTAEGGDAFAIRKGGSWPTAYRWDGVAGAKDAVVFKSDDATATSFTAKVYQGDSPDCMTIPSAKAGDLVEVLITPGTTYLDVKVTVTSGAAPAAPVPCYLDGYYVQGSMNGWNANPDTLIWGAAVDKKTGNISYKYDFKATATEEQFGIAVKGWATKYTGAKFTVGTDEDYVACEMGAGDNNSIAGLKVGSDYRLFIQTTPDGEVSIKAQEIMAYKVSFILEGLEDVDSAWLNGSFWGGWDNGWPIAAWGAPGNGLTLTDAVAVVDGKADFAGSKFDVTGVAAPNEKLTKQVKFVATADDWATTEYDNGNIDVEIVVEKPGTYVVTINCADNEVKSVTKPE